MIRRGVAGLVLLVIAATLLTGCWSRKEVQALAFVMALGVDWDPGAELYDVTLEFVRPPFVPAPAAAGGGAVPDPNQPFFFFQLRAATLADAMDEARRVLTRRLYLGHLQAVVIGEEAARRGVGGIVSWMLRHPEVRPSVEVFLGRPRAREVMAGRPALQLIPGRAISLLAEQAKLHSLAPTVTLARLIHAVLHDDVAPLLPILTVQPSGTPDPSTVPSFLQFKIEGLAAFRGDRLAGLLDERQSRGVMWARGEALGAVLNLETREGERVSLVSRRSRVQMQLAWLPGAELPVVTVAVSVLDDLLVRDEGPATIAKPEEAEMNRLVEELIAAELRAAVAVTQELGADIIGFGDLLRREAPQLWQELRADWPRRYAELPVEVEARVRVKRTGLIR